MSLASLRGSGEKELYGERISSLPNVLSAGMVLLLYLISTYFLSS